MLICIISSSFKATKQRNRCQKAVMWRRHQHILRCAEWICPCLPRVKYKKTTIIIPCWQKESCGQLEARKGKKRWKKKKIGVQWQQETRVNSLSFSSRIALKMDKAFLRGAKIAWFQITVNIKDLTKWIKNFPSYYSVMKIIMGSHKLWGNNFTEDPLEKSVQ